MAKNEIPKISDFQYLGLCDGFAMVSGVAPTFDKVQKKSKRLKTGENE